MSAYKILKIIEKKRDNEELTADEIQTFVDFTVRCNKNETDSLGCKPDRSQVGAMLMAIYLNGINKTETCYLTTKMRDSGDVFEWPSEWKHLVVDKHSTGGVGDKISLVLAPALAAVGLKVPMISGRSLSHTGGTLDKLESIPGFRVDLEYRKVLELVSDIGCCIVGQTDNCCPADKILYATREITGTVPASPLIIASIASKKLSEGINAVVYDVKYGKGSIFKNPEDSLKTAMSLVEVSCEAKSSASAFITSMEAPLGYSIGNTLEVIESVDCLRGSSKSEDVLTLIGYLGGELLRLVRGIPLNEGYNTVLSTLQDGTALEKFYLMIKGQGVSDEIAKQLCFGDNSKMLQQTRFVTNIAYSGEEGYIQEIDPLGLAKIWKDELKASNNNGTGFILLKKVGDYISSGDFWLKLFHDLDQNLTPAQEEFINGAITVSLTETVRQIIDKHIFEDQYGINVENINKCIK